MNGSQADQGKYDNIDGTGKGNCKLVHDHLLNDERVLTERHTPTNPVEERSDCGRQNDGNHALK
jgi:hypothetical protein